MKLASRLCLRCRIANPKCPSLPVSVRWAVLGGEAPGELYSSKQGVVATSTFGRQLQSLCNGMFLAWEQPNHPTGSSPEVSKITQVSSGFRLQTIRPKSGQAGSPGAGMAGGIVLSASGGPEIRGVRHWAHNAGQFHRNIGHCCYCSFYQCRFFFPCG